MSENNSKVGRPSKFKKEYCNELVDHMEKGLSFESFAAVINVNRDTLYEWAKVHSEFSDAQKLGQEKSRLFWEQKGIDGLFNESFGEGQGSRSLNATVWIFNMKNRFGWRDKQPGEEDKTIKHEGEIKVSKVDLEERVKLLKSKS